MQDNQKATSQEATTVCAKGFPGLEDHSGLWFPFPEQRRDSQCTVCTEDPWGQAWLQGLAVHSNKADSTLALTGRHSSWGRENGEGVMCRW